MSQNQTQVGGSHYQRFTIEPIDVIEDWDLNYHEGNVIKYIMRHKVKGGKEDIQKAVWYLQRLLTNEYGE